MHGHVHRKQRQKRISVFFHNLAGWQADTDDKLSLLHGMRDKCSKQDRAIVEFQFRCEDHRVALAILWYCGGP